MERLPGESDNEFFFRHVQAMREQRRLDLVQAKAQAERDGKEPFDEQRFREAYLSVKPYAPCPRELEEDYYLNYRSTRNLEEFVHAVIQTDLYDGGDMHLDKW